MAKYEVIVNGMPRGRYTEGELREIADSGQLPPDAVVRELEDGATTKGRDWLPECDEPSPERVPEPEPPPHLQPYGKQQPVDDSREYVHSGRVWAYLSIASLFLCAPLAIPLGIIAIKQSRGDYRSFWLGATAVAFGVFSTLAFALYELM